MLRLTDFRGHSSAGRAPALQAGGRRFDPVWLHQSGFRKLVRRNEIRVRSHYGLARAKGSRELRRRVISDIVKRRSFRVSCWPQANPVRAPGMTARSARIGWKCFVGSVLDRRGPSVRSCKLVFLISVPSAGGASFRVGTARRVRQWALIMRAIK